MTNTNKPLGALDRVAVYVVFHGNAPVASIAVLRPATPRGRYLTARVTWGGLPPVVGRESGRYAAGKDALTRVCCDAAHRMPLQLPDTEPVDMQGTYSMFVYALRILIPRYDLAQNLQIYNFRTLQVV